MRIALTAPLRSPWPALAAHALALAVCGLIALLTMPLRQTLDLANIIMLFLLGVFLVALRLGRGAAATAAITSVVLFDFFFVPPHLGFIPTDAQYVITLVVMLAVALITARLTADTREHALVAQERMELIASAEQARMQAASDKLRASLLSALSHDLRTPLTALVATADSLALGKIPPGSSPEETAAIIRDQARSMENLIGNVLEMARLQSGRVQLRKDWQLMDDVVAAALRHLRLARNNHAVRLAIAPDLPLIRFDAVLMERVIWNLLENAVKYSPSDAPVEIRAGVDAGKAFLSVCDRGPGFPANRLESLFDLFVRGESESALPGVGLGLAICRAIVEVHGGTIRAENRIDGGACVTIRLPMDVPPTIEDEEADEVGP